MFFHKQCHGSVYLNNNSLRILSEFTITQKGIKPTLSEIVNVGTSVDIEFFCEKCAHTVKTEEIMAYCFNCGHAHTLDEVYKVVRHSGFYCIECCNDFIGSDVTKKQLSTLLKFYNGKGDDNE